MILGDLGADIIKVEHPQGDESRHWGPPFIEGESVYFLSVNRNKRSITLDLNDDESRALVRRIAARADVLIENFLPGSLQRLGLDLADLRSANPRLITLTISGMGATGPDANAPGYDFIMQAAGGLMSITGPAEGPPSKVGVAVVDLTTGMMAANAVLAALYARERNGRGQHIDISLFETQLSWLANVGTAHLMTGTRSGASRQRAPNDRAVSNVSHERWRHRRRRRQRRTIRAVLRSAGIYRSWCGRTLPHEQRPRCASGGIDERCGRAFE
jgi:formyl-CoA transferase